MTGMNIVLRYRRLLYLVPLAARVFAALNAPIQDCDEVFNYWEPTHFLTHGYGLETWEYSPVYAIRSWCYICLHAFVIWVIRGLTALMPPEYEVPTDPYILFYALRIVLGIVCAVGETRVCIGLYRAGVAFKLPSSTRNILALSFLVISTTSTGMFHAGISYLPTSFAMLTSLYAISFFLVGHRTLGLSMFGFGALMGWPFAAILAVPFGLAELWHARWKVLYNASISCLALLMEIVAVDSFFYRTGSLVVVPLNIVLYNVLNADKDHGPDIFGTEPWYYYVLNLLLNFNGAALLAFASLPLVGVYAYLWRAIHPKLSARMSIYVSPLILWSAIFFLQPHKEERFFYPVYPFICLSAAISLALIHNSISKLLEPRSGTSIKSSNKIISTTLCLGALSGISILSILRSAALVVYYAAPLHVYQHLATIPLSHDHYTRERPTSTLCLGKEWYRYPSSYFLPAVPRLALETEENKVNKTLLGKLSSSLLSIFQNGTDHQGIYSSSDVVAFQHTNFKVRFFDAGFDGMLPKDFTVPSNIPSGMNNLNIGDPSIFVNLERDCDYVVDMLESDQQHKEYNSSEWSAVYCEPFLDSAKSRGLAKLIYIPTQFIPSVKSHLEWADYCLFERTRSQ